MILVPELVPEGIYQNNSRHYCQLYEIRKKLSTNYKEYFQNNPIKNPQTKKLLKMLPLKSKANKLQSLDANWGQYEREIWVQEILKLKKRETNEEKKFPRQKYNGTEHRAGSTA